MERKTEGAVDDEKEGKVMVERERELETTTVRKRDCRMYE
jgi:hypothetical protein